MADTVSDRVVFYDRDRTDVADVAQFVFGELVRLSQYTITAYWSDLYHDALWIREYVKGDSYTFFWSVNESGTNIGEDRESVTHRANAYKITVTCDGGAFRVIAEEV